MIRRLQIAWPSSIPLVLPEGRPLRFLAVSDEREPALQHARNRHALEPLDAILGAGDLEPDYLAFLGDAFRCPLLYVRGNHDRGGAWEAASDIVPSPLDGRIEEVAGIHVAGLSWPFASTERAARDDLAAWRQAIGLARRARLPGPHPQIILSHVPPRGLGDSPADPYHAGFSGYRWLRSSLRPVLWVHGHTTLAAAAHWRTAEEETTLLNATGAIFIEIRPGDRSPAPVEGRGG